MESGEKARRADRRLLYRTVRPLVRSWTVGYFRVRVVGADQVPAEGGAVIASNHQSFLDPLFLGVGLQRPLSFMARDTLFRFPPFGALIRALGAFPVRRGARDHSAVRRAVEALRNGALLTVFPEGTRTRTGALGPLRGGVETIAGRADAPVVPAVIEGAFQALPRGSLWIAPTDVWIAFGRPLTPPGRFDEDKQDFREEMRRRMLVMHAALQRLRAGCPLEGDVSRARGGTHQE